MGLQSFFPAEDKGEEESQTSRDGKYFSPDPLEAPLDGSRAGAARAAKLAGDSSVPRPCREPLPAAADSLLGRANLFLLGDRCQHLPSPLCCSPGSDIRLSVCLSAHSQLPRGVCTRGQAGLRSQPWAHSEERFCTPSTQTQPGEDPQNLRGAQGAGFTPWALPPCHHVVFTRGFGDAKAQQAAAERGKPNGDLHGDPRTLLQQLGAGRG